MFGSKGSSGKEWLNLEEHFLAKALCFGIENSSWSVMFLVSKHKSRAIPYHQIVQATAGQFSLLPNQDPTSGNFTKVGQRIPVVISLDGTAGKAIVPGMSAEVTIHLH